MKVEDKKKVKAYAEGYEAYCQGLDAGDNPYERREYEDWYEGYIQAAEERE